jgi:DNA-binding CsgD family transcriptional regulator
VRNYDDIGKKLAARRPDLTERMSVREREVLELALTGATAREIGNRIFRSPTTVITHMEHIFRKAKVTRRDHLILEFAAVDAGVSKEAP